VQVCYFCFTTLHSLLHVNSARTLVHLAMMLQCFAFVVFCLVLQLLQNAAHTLQELIVVLKYIHVLCIFFTDNQLLAMKTKRELIR